jgi:PAS domain S-box-containing protein
LPRLQQSGVRAATPFFKNPSDRRAYAIRVVVVAAAYFGAAKLGLALAFENNSITAVWPPTGIALAALVLGGYRLWPGVALGAFLANSWTGVPLVTVLGITTGNTLEALAGTWLLGRVAFRPSLQRVRDLLALVVLAGALSTAVSATIGVASLRIGETGQAGALLSAWRVWWLGDMAGDLLVAPLILVLATHARPRFSLVRVAEAGALLATVLTMDWLVLAHDYEITYLVFPPLIWAAVRFRHHGATVASVITAGLAAWFTTRHMGPFMRSSSDSGLLLSQSFMSVAGATAIVLAALAGQREKAESSLRNTRAEEELRKRELQLSQSQEVARLGSWEWDIAADTVYWSDELYRIFGLAPDELRSTYEGFLEHVHAEDRGYVDGVMHKALAERGTFRLEHRIVRPDSTVRRLQSRGQMLLDQNGHPFKMVGVTQDATEQKDAEDTLARTHRLLQAILDHSGPMIYVVDTANCFMLINRSCAEFFGLTQEEAVGRSIYDFFPSEVADSLSENNAQILESGEPIEFEEVVPGQDGLHTYLAAKFPLFDSHGRAYAVCGITTDITEREQARQEADRLKDEFFGLVSHELRTPLTSIKGYLELLLSGEVAELDGGRRFLEIIARNTVRLERLVGDLLFAARADAGEFKIHGEVIDLSEVVARCVEAARPQADEKRIELGLQSDSVPEFHGDRDRLSQLFDNLISNAIKYTPREGTVAVHMTRDDMVRVDVTDTGMGISKTDQERLFERFFRTSDAADQAIPGIGLGLTISKAIVEAHEGQISVESSEGGGSTFRVELPFGLPAEIPEARAA